MTNRQAFEIEDILAVLPHRPPFLFVDRVLRLEPGKSIVAERLLRPDEPHFAGHFPGRPIMPGVLIVDALAQTCGLLWGLSQERPVARRFLLGAASVKFPGSAFPGETLRMTARAIRCVGALHRYAVEAAVGRRLVAQGTLTLAAREGES